MPEPTIPVPISELDNRTLLLYLVDSTIRMEQEMSEITTAVAELRSEVAEIKVSVGDLKTRVAGVVTSLTASVETLTSQLTQAQLDDAAVAEAFTEINAQVSELRAVDADLDSIATTPEVEPEAPADPTV